MVRSEDTRHPRHITLTETRMDTLSNSADQELGRATIDALLVGRREANVPVAWGGIVVAIHFSEAPGSTRPAALKFVTDPLEHRHGHHRGRVHLRIAAALMSEGEPTSQGEHALLHDFSAVLS